MSWNGIERRQGADWLIRLLRVTSISSWILYIACLLLFHWARPERNTGIARYYGVDVRKHWDPAYSDLLLYFIWVCAALSLLSLWAGLKRSRRLHDTRRYNLILLALLTVTSGILLTYKIVLS